MTPEQLLNLYKQGLNTTEISQLTNIPVSTVITALEKVDPNYVDLKHTWPIRKKAFLLYAQQKSLRKVGRTLNTPYKTIQSWLKCFHPNYATLVRQGAIASTSDYLNSHQAKRHPKQAQQVKDWLSNNIQYLLQTEANSSLVSFSTRQENTRSRKETGTQRDFKDNFQY